MRIMKFLFLVFVFCSFCLSTFAQVTSLQTTETLAEGVFKTQTPKLTLSSYMATQRAKNEITATVDKFRFLSDKIGNTDVQFQVTSDNESYISLIFYGVVHIDGAAHPETETHALVINKQTGENMTLTEFINIPSVRFIHQQAKLNKIKVYAADRKTEINNDIAKILKSIPQEYVVDNYGNIYLLATDMTIYATGTPLICLPLNDFQSLYVAKG